ncbi:MAG: RNA-binding protein [Deltaproteobacteria bacterium]|nr:RNA-binding protein [Deltaproteobacteria bacterium]
MEDKTITFNEAWVTVFIGNLPFEYAEKDVRSLLESYGAINSLRLLTHPESGESQGICFVEMDPDGADAAIEALNGRDLSGRKLSVRFVKQEDTDDTQPV